MKFEDQTENDEFKDLLTYYTTGVDSLRNNARELDDYFDALELPENGAIIDEILAEHNLQSVMKIVEKFRKETGIPVGEADSGITFSKLAKSIQTILQEGGRDDYISHRLSVPSRGLR